MRNRFTRSGEAPLPGARFVTAGLVSLALLMVLSAARADSSPAVQTDRSAKLDLIARLKQGPEILVLGDSRGRQAEPSFLQRLTGHTGFNAAVAGGSAPDAWVFTRYAADRFPGQKRRYIWFVSSGLATDIVDPRTRADPRGRRYLREVVPYLSTQVISVPGRTDTRYGPDGSLPGGLSAPSPEQVRKVKAEAARMVAAIRLHPPTPSTPDITRFRLFEHVLAYMNARGERPVIVFNPVYPTVFAELEKYGRPLATASLGYLQNIAARDHFVVVDCEDVRKWGGTDYDWTNATHVNRANMRRMLRYVVSHSDGAL